MDIREKLVELLQDGDNPVWGWFPNNATMIQLADYLIAHGVTAQDNTEISDELLQRLRNAPITVITEEPSVEVANEWISVKDRLPEEKVDCIVHYKHAYCDNDDYWAIGMCFYDGEKFQLGPAYKVTHWMPIPLAPEVKND